MPEVGFKGIKAGLEWKAGQIMKGLVDHTKAFELCFADIEIQR